MNTAKELVENPHVETVLGAEECASTMTYRYCKATSKIVTVYLFEDGSYLIEDGSKVLDYSQD